MMRVQLSLRRALIPNAGYTHSGGISELDISSIIPLPLFSF